MNSENSQWLRAVFEGNRELMESLYRDNREVFVQWGVSKFRLSKEELLDIYQEASLIMYENILERKITDLRSSLKTYLFGIAKNLVFKNFRVTKKKEEATDIEEVFYSEPSESERELMKWGEKAMELLDTMDEPCRSILERYYRRSEKLDEITNAMNYSSKDVVKTQKSRCLKQLKNTLAEALKLDEI